MPDTPDDRTLGPGPNRPRLSDDRPHLGDDFADSSLADRHRLGDSFADPNSSDDAKLGESFIQANSTPKHRRDRRLAEQPPKKKADHRVFYTVVLIVAILFIIIFFAGFLPRHRQNKRNDQQVSQQQSATPVVDAIRVARPPAGSPLVVPGTTTPLTEAFIYARSSGYLTRRFADIGDRVHRGQLLAIVDSPDLDQQVDQAREQLRQAESQKTQQDAQLALAKVTVARYRTLVAKGVFSRQDGDQQETNFSAQVANVAAAERNVEAFRANLRRVLSLQSYEHVTAPFDGVVTQRNVDVGALISSSGTAGSSAPGAQAQAGPSTSGTANSAGTTGNAPTSASPQNAGGNGGPLFAVAQVNRLRILVSVPEGYASSVHRGQTASLRFQEFPAEQFNGLVTRTASSIDQNTRTLLTEIQVDNRQGRLLNGMYTVATFAPVASGAGPITIAGDAIAVRDGRNVVGIIRDGIVHIQPVDVGRDFGPVLEVMSGLKVGDIIASNVTDDVRDGLKVDAKIDDTKSQSAAKPASTQQNTPPGGSSQYGDQSITDANMQGLNAGGGSKAGGQGGGKGGGKPGGAKPTDPFKGESKQ